MRGWLHFWSFVVSIASGVALVAVAGARVGRGAALATAVYSVTILGLFGVSALYHRHTWRTPRARAIMKRLDHSMIFLFIAGTYTPVAVLAMDPRTARWVLTVVWGGALAGVVLKTAWPHAPSWLAVPIYMALGWVAVFVFPELLANGGRRGVRAADRGRRALHGGRRLLRDEVAEPVAEHLRLPRVLPRGHGAGGALPPRRDLAGAVRAVRVLRRRALGAQLVDLRHGVAQLGQPLVGVLARPA